MSKSVLVIDTPECCDGCEMCDRIPGPWCRATGGIIAGEPESGRAAGCPLKPMPERKIEHDWCDPYEPDFEMGTERGWNECIDEILGDRRQQ